MSAISEEEEFEFRLRMEQEQSAPQPMPEQKGLVRRGLESVAKSDALPIIGGIVGGVAGAPLGPGAIGTAALGGAAGESYRQLMSRGLGMESPQTPMDAAKDIGVAGAIQGAGEAGGMALRPIGRAIGAIPGVRPVLNKVENAAKSVAGDVFQLATKMRPDDAATLFKNPGAILPSSMSEASGNWKAAANAAGIPTDEISPEMLRILKGDSKAMVFETYERLVSGQPISAKEAQLAKQALDIAVMPVAKTVRKNPLVATLQKMRQAFTERIGQESPELAAANKDYAIASTGKRFRSLFPRNTTGDPALFRSAIIPGVGLAESLRTGDPMEFAKFAGIQAGMSPLAIGSGIAMAGKMANPTTRRILTATAARKLLGERNAGAPKPTNNFVGNDRGPAQSENGKVQPQNGQQNNGSNGANQATPKKILAERPAKVPTKEILLAFLRKARGDKEKARRMAVAEGYDISKRDENSKQ